MPAAVVEDENGTMPQQQASRRSQRARSQKRYVEPSSSEDESDSDDGQSSVLTEQGATRVIKPKSRGGAGMDRARKLELRKIRNRQSAAASRKRKSDRILELEAQVAQLMEENASLKAQIPHATGTLSTSTSTTSTYSTTGRAAKRSKLAPPTVAATPASSPSLARRRRAPTPPSSFDSSTDGSDAIDLCTNQLPAVYATLLIR